MLAEELQLPATMRLLQFFEEAAAEQPRQHAHRQEEARLAGDPALAVGRKPAAGHDAVHMRMMRQRRAPGVQHQRDADLRTEMLRIGGDRAQRLGGDVEQQAVDDCLVVVGDGADRRRQREDHVVVRHGQQIGLPCLEPALRGARLALRAMPVAAGVVGDLRLCARMTAQHMSAQRRAAALFDGRHDLELAEAQVAVLCCRHVGPWARKMSATSRAGRPTRGYGVGAGPGSSGLITSRRSSVATWV